jgi:hypothetical protein
MADKIIETEREYFAPRTNISWGAIFAGWLFAYAFALLLYLLGAAIGVTSLAAFNTLNKGVAVGTGVWMIVAWVVATFFGSMIAGRFSGSAERNSGVLHGLTVWALSGIMTLVMASIQTAGAAAVGINATKTVAQAGEKGGEGLIPNELQQSLAGEVKQQAADAINKAGGEDVTRREALNSIEQLDQDATGRIAMALIQGNTEQAKNIVAQETELSENEVDSVISGLGQRAEYYKGEAKNKAGDVVEQAGDYTSAGLWAAFLASLLGLLAGAWGGSIGAQMSYRRREYPSVVAYKSEESRRAI